MEIRSHIPSASSLDNLHGPSGSTSNRSAALTAESAVAPDSAHLHFASALSGDDVRLDRVQQLQARIAQGSYSVDPLAVADKMLQEITPTR